MGLMYLLVAIITEVIGMSALKAAEGFTRLWPSVICVVSYVISFYFLSLTLKFIPIGLVYAIWAGVGIVLVSAIGYFFFKQSLDLPAVVGIGLIASGVLVINTLSNSISH